MIEVLFGDNEAESMKVAKCLQSAQSEQVDGPTSVFKRQGTEMPAKLPSAEWIQGTPEEVICLGFMLDAGNIKDLKSKEGDYSNELKRLKKFLDDGQKVRIWYSNAPYSICGFYSLCQLFQNYPNEIHVVKLPEYVVTETGIYVCTNWGNVAAEEFAGFLSYETILTDAEVKMYAQKWSELKAENSPLRAVVNGKVISVPEDFYDFMIWQELSEEPVKEGKVIGNIIDRYQTGISFEWLIRRIEYLISQGKIKVVENCENNLARLICKSL